MTYGCGNCRLTFKTQQELIAHQPCPLYLIEKELAEYNLRIQVLLQQGEER